MRVEISKRVSDGDYGFEQCQAQYVAELEALTDAAMRGRLEHAA